MRSQGLLLLLFRLSATALIPSASNNEGFTTMGIQLASAFPMSGMSSWSHFGSTGTAVRMNSQSSLRRASLADRTSDQYHGDDDDDKSDSDSSTTTKKAVNPHEMDLSHVSDDTVTSSSDNTDDKVSSDSTDDDDNSSDTDDDNTSTDNTDDDNTLSDNEDDHTTSLDNTADNTPSSDTDAIKPNDNTTATELDAIRAKAGNADYYSARQKSTHTKKGLNGTEPMNVLAPSPSSSSSNTTNNTSSKKPTVRVPTLSQWDSPNATFDPTHVVTNSTVLIPPEQTQPDSWPVIIVWLFALLAAGLCSATAIKSCKNRKHKNYDEIESLIV
jgi:hypothetical protein